MAWACGFRSHIDNVGAFGRELFRLVHGGIEAKEFAAVGKGIGGYVQDTHDDRSRAQKREEPVAALAHGETIDLRDGGPASVNHWFDNP
jgi:hypothetical protein